MAEIDEIGVVDGIPTSGTGEVPTLAVIRDKLDELIAIVGAVDDAKVVDPDASGTLIAFTKGNVQKTTDGIVATGQTTKANSISMTWASDESRAHSASATFTPANASHTAGDANDTAKEFTNMGPSGGRVVITSASLEIDGGTAEATAWRLALFNVTPPSALADDAAFTLPSGDRASFLGFVELGTAVDEVDTQWIEVHGINKQVKLAGTSIFAYLINRTTLSPANVAHIVTLHTVDV